MVTAGGNAENKLNKTKYDKLFDALILLYICVFCETLKYTEGLEYADNRDYKFDYLKLSRQLGHFGCFNDLELYKRYHIGS